MKKIIENYEMIITGVIFMLIIVAMCLGLCGCGDGTKTTESNTYLLGSDGMIEVGDLLYYDSETGIVYWWNGGLAKTATNTTPTPYYSSNGLLCKYNPNTNTIEEICENEVMTCETEVNCTKGEK